jgi:hypothetical protein
MDQIYDGLGIEFDDFTDVALNDFFNWASYSSLYSFRNLGSSLLYGFAVIIIYLLLGCVRLIACCLSAKARHSLTSFWIYQHLKNFLLVRFILSFYIPYCISIGINLNSLVLTSPSELEEGVSGELLSSILSILLAPMILAVPLIFTCLRHKDYACMTLDKKSSLNDILSMYKQLITIIVLLVLRSHPGIALALLIPLHLGIQAFKIGWRL